MNRILAKKNGNKNDILFIILGAIHGNEPVGIKVIERLFSALKTVSVTGTVVGIIGNKKAYLKGVRYIEHDLNRLFLKNIIEESYAKKNPTNEYKELIELIDCIRNEIKQTTPKRIFLIDVHSTSADSPLFSIVNDDETTWEIAAAMQTPVVTGLSGKFPVGSTVEYFTQENFDVPITAVSVEAGQHKDSKTIQHAFNYLVKMFEYIGLIEKSAIDISDAASSIKNLPTLVKFIYRHAISPDDAFAMDKGYESFQAVKKGEILGSDKTGPVISPQDGYILMPLYQKQGNDGFFLVGKFM